MRVQEDDNQWWDFFFDLAWPYLSNCWSLKSCLPRFLKIEQCFEDFFFIYPRYFCGIER